MKLMANHTIHVGKWTREPGTRDPDDPGVKEIKVYNQLDVFESTEWMSDEDAEVLVASHAAIIAPSPGDPIHLPSAS